VSGCIGHVQPTQTLPLTHCMPQIRTNSREFVLIHVRISVEIQHLTDAYWKKKERKTTAVKYQPFGIAMPCGLITSKNKHELNRGTLANLLIGNVFVSTSAFLYSIIIWKDTKPSCIFMVARTCTGRYMITVSLAAASRKGVD